MTLDEYLGHMNDKLMNEHYESLTLHDVGYNGLAEIVAKAVEMLREDYVLTHKSHIGTMQAYDLAACGYRTRADVMVMVGDVCPDVELLYSSLSMEDLLKQHEDWTVDKLIKYLEAPKPEQTQPAQS